MTMFDVLILVGVVVIVVLGGRWTYREFMRGGSVHPTEGYGPHRRPFIRPFIRWEQDKEDEQHKENRI